MYAGSGYSGRPETGPSLQPGDINNSGNGPELAGLHRHHPMITDLAERSGNGSAFSGRRHTVSYQASHPLV